jgi:hypothetical protein
MHPRIPLPPIARPSRQARPGAASLASKGCHSAAVPRPSARRRSVWSPAAAVALALAFLAPVAAMAQNIENPPVPPRGITIFPERDFLSAEGFVPNADVLVQVLRNGVLSDAEGRTDGSGLLEVNHPGGVCWRGVTPDIGPADVVQVTYRNTANNSALPVPPLFGAGSAAVTQNVSAAQAYDAGDGTVVVKGKAQLADGTRIPLDRLEVRIINADFRNPPASRITRRDIRADSAGGRVDGVPNSSGTLAYDAGGGTGFTAVFRGLSTTERSLAVQGQTRIMGWQATTAAGDRLGVTIYEVGEVGGPGIGGCPPGPGGAIPAVAPTPPVRYTPAMLVNADQPQVPQGLVTVFPERDFISVEGYPAGADLQVVVRRGTSTTPIVGTARGIVPAGGVFEVNHPGGVCWTGQTPDIQAGDWIDVFQVVDMGFSKGQKQQVLNTRVTKSASISSNTVQVTGRSYLPNGQPMPLTQLEQRIINPDFVDTRIGRRDIRADSAGGRVGNIATATGRVVSTGSGGGSEWRATYTGLNATEQRLAVAGQNRAMSWLSTNGNGDRLGMTISEFGELGGPGFGGCPATGNTGIAMP